jgi:hypothetical protein
MRRSLILVVRALVMNRIEIKEARRLFEQAEKETDALLKLTALEEAFDLIDDFQADNPSEKAEVTYAINLRNTYLELLIRQLVTMKRMESDVWFKYFKLLLFRFGPEVEHIIGSNSQLRDSYKEFKAQWGNDFLLALRQST